MTSVQASLEDGDHNLDDAQILQYLLQNPDFFARHPQLLEQIEVPHAQKGSVSLIELQSDQLRKKLQIVKGKFERLINTAKQNEKIYRVYTDLNLRLIKAEDFEQLRTALEQALLNQLRLSAVALKPFKGAFALPEIQQKLFKEKHFKNTPFFFGRLGHHEKHLLFTDEPAESAALILLSDEQDQGILAIGSHDPSHFNPDMDTLLLTQLQQVLTVLMPKLLHY